MSATYMSLEASNLKDRVEKEELEKIQAAIADVAEVLVVNGARLSLDPPPLSRDRGKTDKDAEDLIVDAYDRSSLKIGSNKTLMESLGGPQRLNRAKAEWSFKETEDATSMLHFRDQLHSVASLANPHSTTPRLYDRKTGEPIVSNENYKEMIQNVNSVYLVFK